MISHPWKKNKILGDVMRRSGVTLAQPDREQTNSHPRPPLWRHVCGPAGQVISGYIGLLFVVALVSSVVVEPLVQSRAWGNARVMGLRALHMHRHLPTAAALISVLLYTVLATSHIVSQATRGAASSASGNVTRTVAKDEAGCHETGRPNRDLPNSPSKKCPFCTGYAALHLSVVSNPISITFGAATSTQLGSLGDVRQIEPADSHSWHPRAPPRVS